MRSRKIGSGINVRCRAEYVATPFLFPYAFDGYFLSIIRSFPAMVPCS